MELLRRIFPVAPSAPRCWKATGTVRPPGQPNRVVVVRRIYKSFEIKDQSSKCRHIFTRGR